MAISQCTFQSFKCKGRELFLSVQIFVQFFPYTIKTLFLATYFCTLAKIPIIYGSLGGTFAKLSMCGVLKDLLR